MKHLLYDQTIELNFDEKTHSYSIDGKKADGVTSILSIIAKPALVYWAVGEAVSYIENNLRPGFAYDEIQLRRLIGEAKYAHKKTSSEASTMGTIIHEWCADWIAGKNPKMPFNPQIKSSVEQFLKWVERDKVEFLHSEKLIYSRNKNYAGTFDFIAKIDGKTYLGDFKSSSGIWDEYWLQVAGYQQAYLEEFPNKEIDGAVIVRLGKKNELEVKYSNDYDRNVVGFNSALDLYRCMMFLKDGKANENLS